MADDAFPWPLDWLAQHPHWAGALVFLVAMVESLAVVGLILPGTVLMFGIGALVALDVLPLWPTLIWAALGAVVGDGLSYWLGRRYRDTLFGMWPLSRYQGAWQRGIEFFQRHGGKSILIGRFVGPMRPIVPAIAGMLHMPPRHYLPVNIISALAWAPAYILPGVVFGASLELAAAVATRLIFLLVLVAATLWAVVWGVGALYRLLQPHTARLAQALLTAGRRHPLLGRWVGPMLDPDHSPATALWLWSVTLVVTLTSITVAVSGGGEAAFAWDDVVGRFLQGLRTPAGDAVLAVLASGATWPVAIGAWVTVSAWLSANRDWPTLGYWLAAGPGTFGLAWACVQLSGWLTGLDRVGPAVGIAVITALWGFGATWVAAQVTLGRSRVYMAAALALTAPLCARLWLGTVGLSNLMGGLGLGLVWATVLGAAHRRHVVPAAWAGWSAAVLLVGFVGTGLAYLVWTEEVPPGRYSEVAGRRLTADAWWDTKWRTLPLQQRTVAGRRTAPFQVQWAGEPEVLIDSLKALGWQPAPRTTLRRSLIWLNPDADAASLPVLPQAHDGRYAALSFIRVLSPERRRVLRFWATDVTLIEGGKPTPVWVGRMADQAVQTWHFLLTRAVPDAGDFVPTAVALGRLPGLETRPVSVGEGAAALWLVRPRPEPRTALDSPWSSPVPDAGSR